MFIAILNLAVARVTPEFQLNPMFWFRRCHLKIIKMAAMVALKIRARSPKPDQVFPMLQCYIHTNLVPICSLVNVISCTQESVHHTPTPMGSAPKTINPIPLKQGDNWQVPAFGKLNLLSKENSSEYSLIKSHYSRKL